MSSRRSSAAARLAFLSDFLCFQPVFLSELDGHGGHSGKGRGEGCDQDDEGASPCALPGSLGTNHGDTMVGSDGGQHFIGLNGDDILSGGAGPDCLEGGNGKDVLDGGAGRDFLDGGNGDDVLRGGQGRDDLFGGNGNDLLIGGFGPDLLHGGSGDDILFGGNGPDSYIGGTGSDVFVLALPGSGGEYSETSAYQAFVSLAEIAEEHGDVIRDFRQGVDHLALAGGITFDQLRFEGEDVYVVEGLGAGAPVSIRDGESGGVARLLVTIAGFDATKLRASDFLSYEDFFPV